MPTQVDHAREQAEAQLVSIERMLERLEHAQTCDDAECAQSDRDDYHDEDGARAAIEEDPLSIEVRSAWETIGTTLEPAEYCILLCTGGPAVRIIGDLDGNSPSRARLEYQDWGTPWTEYITTGPDHAALLDYAGHFYFGD